MLAINVPDAMQLDPEGAEFKLYEFKRLRIKRENYDLTAPQPIPSSKGQFFAFRLLRNATNIVRQKISRTRPPSPTSPPSPPPTPPRRAPMKRSGHRAVCNEANLWVWGGFCPTDDSESNENDDENEPQQTSARANPLLPELWRFNFATRVWRLIETSGDIPTKTVASHAVFLAGHSLIVVGGTSYPFGQELHSNVHTCNLKTYVWKKYTLTGVPPMALYGSSVVMHDDLLYILFGTTSTIYVSNVYEINTKTLESKQLFNSVDLLRTNGYLTATLEEYPNHFLEGRYRQECVLHDEKIYTFAGSTYVGTSFDLITLPAFDLMTQKWIFPTTLCDKATNSYPQSRKFHSCCKVGSYVFIIGGIDYAITATNRVENKMVENCLWRLDFTDMRWLKLDKIQIPCNTYFNASCSNQNGQIFIHGGVKLVKKNETDEGTAVRINHLYILPVQIMKLSEMCWSKLIQAYPKFLIQDKATLLNMGIAARFVERIEF